MAKLSEGIINAVKADPFDQGSTERNVGRFTEEEIAKYEAKQAAKQEFAEARKVANSIVDRNISDMQNEIQQGENFGAEARKNKKEDDKSSISKTVVIGSPLPSKKEIAAKGKADKKAFSKSLNDSKDFAYKKAAELDTQADELEQEANNTEDEDEKSGLLKQAKSLRAEAERRRKDADITYNKTTKKETLVSPDSGHSGPTAEAADTSAPGTKNDPDAKYGHKASDPAPKLELPTARSGLLEDKANAEKTLTDKRKERDEFIETAKKNKKTAKRNMREQSIMSDDFDFDDEFDSTDTLVASFFKKGKINKLLKDQIKEQYPDELAEIAERVKNDPDNAGLSGREIHKLITAEVNKFVEHLWKEAGGDTQVNKIGLVTPVAAAIKQTIYGNANESIKKVLSDKRAALEKKQNRSLRDQMFLDAFNMIEKGIDTEKKTAELKGEVQDALNNLTNINAEVRAHKKEVDRVRSSFYKDGDIETKITHKNGWTFFDRGKAHYAAQVEDRDGKKKYVIYSATEGSPDTQRDPVWEFDYQDYNGTNNTNEKLAIQRIEGDNGQVEGGFKGRNEAIRNAQNKQDFESLDGQDYFKYSKAHKIMAPKIMKLISDLGGKIDRSTGKIYTTSVADFPEGADELYLDYATAKKLAGKSDEDIARLTGMSLDEVKARQIIGMIRDYSIGDARVIQDDQGRAVYQLPEDNKTSLSGAAGRSFYINWNEPHNRKIVAEYAKMGKTKQDIPLSELKTVNTSRSTEGNIDWSDKDKTKAAEKAQKAQYTGAYKPSASVLDALIGFGRK